MPSSYQGDSLQALLALFLQAQGYPLPQHCPTKSPSALSRFLNHYDWPTRRLIRSTRRFLVHTLLEHRPRGRRPHLQVILDLTCLQKRGKFAALPGLIRVFHGKRGLQVMFAPAATCRIAYVLAHWGYLLQAEAELDWGAAAQRILELLLPQVVLAGLVKEIERLRPLAQQQGLDFQILGCKI